MKKWVAAAVLAGASLLSSVQLERPDFPDWRPPLPPTAYVRDGALKEVKVNAFYDEEFENLHSDPRAYISDVVDAHNMHWRMMRPEKFVLEDVKLRRSANKADGNYHLRKLIKELQYKQDEVNVYFMGQEIFFYDLGYPEHYGGVAHGDDNIMIVFAGKLKRGDDEWTDDRIKVAFTHEAGHLYGARDLPLSRSETTYAIGRAGGMEEFSVDAGSKHIISHFTPSPSSRQSAYRMITNLESHILKHFVNAQELKPIVQDLVYHANLQNNEEYAWTVAELKAAGIECEEGVFDTWLRSYERKAGSLLNWAELHAVSDEYFAADEAFKAGDMREALYRNLVAQSVYKGKDARIIQAMDAMDHAIAHEALTAASTSLRSR